MNIGVVLAAGDSKRFGGYMNKQYLKLNGKEVVSYSINSMRACSNIDVILLVVDKKEFEEKYIEKKYSVECVLGGETRNQSIHNAIIYIKEHYPSCEKVIFHDSVRPLAQSSKFQRFIDELDNYDCVVTQSGINDALVNNDYMTQERDLYKLILSPEAVRYDILEAFDSSSNDLAIASQFNDRKIYGIASDIFNTKITYPEDLFILEQLSRLDYYSVDHDYQFVIKELPKRVLLFGASGGIGGAIKKYLQEKGIECLAPSHKDLDLKTLDVDKITNYINGRQVDAIINAAAIYYDDNDGLARTFDDIFAVNVKANVVLIEYAQTLHRTINLVFLSSSSSTKGRENLTNYSAAKAALNSIVESMARRLSLENIYINAVIPEKVNTPLIQKLHKTKIDDRELLEPKDVVNAIMYFSTAHEYGKLLHIRKGL